MSKYQAMITRFFDGETTPEEEKQLYTYFKGEEVDPADAPLKQLFTDMSVLQADETKTALPKIVKTKTHHNRWKRMAWAAVIIMLLLFTIYLNRPFRSDYEVIVYGQRSTDKEMVMQEVNRTMQAATNPTTDIEGELKQIFAQ